MQLAVEFSSTDFSFGCYFVYINRSTGVMHHDSDGSEDVMPEDIDDSEKYIQVPSKTDLGLGKPLVIRFSSEKIPEKLDQVYEIFSRKGAYQKYKGLLSSLELLDTWFEYEAEQQKKALIEWCHQNKIELGN